MRKRILSQHVETFLYRASKRNRHGIPIHAGQRFNLIDGEKLGIRPEPGHRVRSVNVMRAKEMHAAKRLKIYGDMSVLAKFLLHTQAGVDYITGGKGGTELH